MFMRIETPRLDPLVAALVFQLHNKKAFVKNWANSAAIEARGNARAKGGRRYWKDLARSLQVRQVSETAVSVSSSQIGAGLKQYGGVVRPITARALTIPVTAEAKGKTAYEFERPDRPLFVVSEKTGDPGTIGVLGYAKKTRKENVSAFHPLFVLRKYAKMKPDPWFPTKNRIEFFASREAKLLFHREEKNWNTRRT